MRRCCFFLVLLATWPVRAEDAPLTTKTWEEPRVNGVGWRLLALPESLVELAFAPLGLVLDGIEHYRVRKRLDDWTTWGPVSANPRIAFATSDTFGGGAKVSVSSGGGSEQKFSVSALARINGDYDIGGKYSRRLASLEGRRLAMRVLYRQDSTTRFYLLGDSDKADRSALGMDFLNALVSLDVSRLGTENLLGVVQLGFRQERLYAGVSSRGEAPLMAGSPGAPPGFGESNSYPYAGVELRLDTRDSLAGTSRGILARVRGSATVSVPDGQYSALAGQATAVYYVPVLPRRRTLSLHAGVGAVEPVRGEVPLNWLVTLGRRRFLRGFDSRRFRDRRGMWAGAEYRFPVWYYLNTEVTLTASGFFEAGKVAGSFAGLFEGPIRYAYGGGFGIESRSDAVLQFQLGASKEGTEIVFSGGARL